jgi:hypothetical protein
MKERYSYYLSVESDSIGLTLGANTTGPGRVFTASFFYPTAEIFQDYKLTPGEEKIVIKS